MLYKDERPVYNWTWNDNVQEIIVPQYIWNPNSIWTIDYVPDFVGCNPYIVDFQSLGVLPTEAEPGKFSGNEIDRNGRLELKHYPFVDFERLKEEGTDYNPVKITIHGDGIQGKNGIPITTPIESCRNIQDALSGLWKAACLNVTNYEENALTELNPYDPKNQVPPTFEYAHGQIYISSSHLIMMPGKFWPNTW